MKKTNHFKKLSLLILLSCLFTSLGAVTITSISSGNWNAVGTWDTGVPGASDDVVIASSNAVTINTTQSCDQLDINSGGTLEIVTSASLTATNHVYVYGTLTMTAGIFNAGSTTAKYFHINGGIFNFSGGTINIAGRYKQNNGGNANLSGSGIINVSTSGVQTASTISNFTVAGTGTFAVSNGSSVQIIIKNGNYTAKEEVTYSPATSDFNGGSLVFENGSGLTDIYIKGDESIYKIESNTVSGVFHFSSESAFSLTDFTITSGTVQVDAGAQIDITGTSSLGSDNIFTIVSGESSSASVIFSNLPSNTVNLQRYFTSGEWHLFGVPITGIDAEYMHIPFIDTWMLWFDEGEGTSGDWQYIIATETVLTPTEGFMYYIDEAASGQSITYTGSLITSNKTFGLYKDKMGWNALSNPYSSALDWDIGTWDKTNTTGAVYVWDDSESSYLSRNSSGVGTLTNGIIPVCQGFFVQANSAANFTIPTDARVHSDQAYYKESDDSLKDDEPSQYIRLDLNDGIYGNTVFVGFTENGTDDFDYGGDATKLYSSIEEIQLFAKENEHELCINANSALSEPGDTVFLHLVQVSDEEHTLRISDLDQLPGTIITLEDLKTGTILDLNEQPVYTFTSSINDAAERFLLHFTSLPVEIDEYILNKSNIDIYSYGKDVYVRSNKTIQADIFIFDLLGRKLLHKKVEDSKLQKFSFKVNNTYLIVKIVEEGFVKTEKVFIK